MGKVERFEDLNCWKEARELVKEIYIICEEGKLSRDFDTKSQIKRAALSIMNNIAEGFGKYSTKEFIRYLDTAHNSASEVKSIVYVLIDLNYLEETKAKEIQDRADKVKALSLALIRYLANRTK
jgi:four helix bundle protein